MKHSGEPMLKGDYKNCSFWRELNPIRRDDSQQPKPLHQSDSLYIFYFSFLVYYRLMSGCALLQHIKRFKVVLFLLTTVAVGDLRSLDMGIFYVDFVELSSHIMV